ncbi:Avirulence (Avh) protein [Phytophthora megakarya]|uniref:RxLR effector protein n=1 Tax=Phytophthora megakarya TaxID=4795 RepID=A0A225VXJ4_9STRA|nr:Avirulence (Avh) protein [Phytophthora megakarya]
MRCVFFVAIAVAVLTRSSVVTAFAKTEESNLLSKTTPDFATDAVISQKRFLRVADPGDAELTPDDEERVKFKLLSDVIETLEKAKDAPKKAVEGVKKATKFTKKELEAAAALLKLKDQ